MAKKEIRLLYLLMLCAIISIGGVYSLWNQSELLWQANIPVVKAPEEPIIISKPPVASTTLDSQKQLVTNNQKKCLHLSAQYNNAKIVGDMTATLKNYRRIQVSANELWSNMPQDKQEVKILKIIDLQRQAMAELTEASMIMADYLEGKRSIMEPNPDWVEVARNLYQKSQAKLARAAQLIEALEY